MTIKINYKNKNIKKTNTNLVLFVDERFVGEQLFDEKKHEGKK